MQGQGELQLDRVPATDPALGPAPPDGGWGWAVALAGALHNTAAPALLVAYGVIIAKANKEEREEGHVPRIWDVNIALVPILFVVIRLLLETYCRAVVRVVNMPRFMALAGLCLTVAGVLLSSFATNSDDNEFIVNIFSGIFAGAGSALTGQQTEVIIKHYFRNKLLEVQTVVRLGPSIGNCVVPIFVGFLCSTFTNDIVLMIYGAALMQNCFFLAAYTRPIYITKPLKQHYKILKDAEEDEDEDIFTKNKQNPSSSNDDASPSNEDGTRVNNSNERENNNYENTEDNDEHVIASFAKNTTREIISPSVQMRDVTNRFSSDFSNFNASYMNVNEQPDLDIIERVQEQHQPEPLYRETTVVAPSENGFNFTFDHNMPQGTARRNASMKKNFISVISMFLDIEFYLYTLLHINTTYCILIFGVIFPSFLSQKMPQQNTYQVSVTMTVAHSAAFAFILLCTVLPKSIKNKSRVCAAFCIVGAVGFYGITLATKRSFLIIWGMLASYATSSASILQQAIFDDMLNEFDATATSTAANFLAAGFIMVGSFVYDYELYTCFQFASLLHIVTALVFIGASMRKKRR